MLSHCNYRWFKRLNVQRQFLPPACRKVDVSHSRSGDVMDRREFLRSSAAAAGLSLAAFSGCATPGSRPDNRPNILFICTDQFNASCAGFAGHPLVYTPNLDRLAARGTVFTNFYSNSPVCVPARAAMFSGLYPHEVEAYDNASPFDGRVPCWTNHLTDSGYRCRATGKLDFLFGRDYGMEEVDTEHGHDLNPDVTAFFRRPIQPRIDSRRQIEGYLDENPHHDTRFVAEAARFLAAEAGSERRPWMQYVGLNSPHPPFVVPRKYFEMYPLNNISLPDAPGGRPPELHPVMAAANHYNMFDTEPFSEGRIVRARAAYYGMITRLDEWVGTILTELERCGQQENTIVIFTADHGEMLGDHGMWFKGTPYDQAARVPLVIAGGPFGAGTVDTPASHVDLAATMLELGGLSAPAGLRGRSLLPLLSGEESGGERAAYGELNNEGNTTGYCWLRTQQWKYVHFVGYEPMLFDMEADPRELNNLAADPG
ncbi:MAG: sulfatase-like hydrolase/transferase, partial [Candidatus Glassbacteria bacterium]|nr:sulfatase-like hydrolase/transferase [Candidatus Glassbacteria bacterium]